MDTSSWIHRRVETLSYRDRLIIRRSVSVDFTVPPDLPPFGELPSGRCIYYAPISLLRKWPPLPSFDLRDEAGRPIPLLSSERNRHVDAAALLAIAPDGPLKTQLKDTITAIPVSSPPDAQKQFDSLARAVLAADPPSRTTETGAWLETLVLAGDLVRNCILWARIRAVPDQRLVIKFAFDEPADLRESAGRAIVRSLGWVPYRYSPAIPHLGDGGSFHAHFEPPPGFEIRTVSFWALHPWNPVPPDAKNVLKRFAHAIWRGVRGKLAAVFSSLAPAAMSHPDDPPDGEPSYWNARQFAQLYISGRRKHVGYAKFECAVDSQSFPTSALLATVAIGALLTVAACNSAAFDARDQFVPTVTVFLLVPGLLGYVVSRSVEHPLVTAHLAGIRRLAVIAGALPIVAAVRMLVAGPDNSGAVHDWWVALAAGAWVISLLLLLSWLLPGPEFKIDRTVAPPSSRGSSAD